MAACPAGDICALARLVSAETGDTLSSPGGPAARARRGTCPPRSCRSRWRPPRAADEDRLATALARLVAEDPTVRLERRPDTGQLLLWCVGEAHAEVLLERLRTRHGVAVDTRAGPRADGRDPGRPGAGHRPAREAVRRPRAVRRRRRRGRARAARARASSSSSASSAAPCPASSTAAWRRASGRRPSAGISGDRPLVDVHVTLVDGKAHSVDSSDAAFQAAGALALRELAAAAGTRILEPWCEVDVVVPGEYVGAVMSDLSGRRARVTGSEADPVRDRTTVRAEVPEIELLSYPGRAALGDPRDRQLHPPSARLRGGARPSLAVPA